LKFERLTDNKEAILIAMNELPDQYKDMPALVLDNEDDKEELTEGAPPLHISKENQ